LAVPPKGEHTHIYAAGGAQFCRSVSSNVYWCFRSADAQRLDLWMMAPSPLDRDVQGACSTVTVVGRATAQATV
jgi:hypothetical protein